LEKQETVINPNSKITIYSSTLVATGRWMTGIGSIMIP